MQIQRLRCPHCRMDSVHTKNTVDTELSGLWTVQKYFFYYLRRLSILSTLSTSKNRHISNARE
jgi:hypothetical protein